MVNERRYTMKVKGLIQETRAYDDEGNSIVLVNLQCVLTPEQHIRLCTLMNGHEAEFELLVGEEK